MLCYFMKAKPYQEISDDESKTKPPRILQNVHGYLKLDSKLPTRIDLCNSWEPDTVDFVYFYGIDFKSLKSRLYVYVRLAFDLFRWLYP